MSEEHDERPDDDDDDDDDLPRGFRVHGIVKIHKKGDLVTRTRILVEDEQGCDVRILVEDENQFGGDANTLTLADADLVELIHALELVAKRRGLIDPTGN